MIHAPYPKPQVSDDAKPKVIRSTRPQAAKSRIIKAKGPDFDNVKANTPRKPKIKKNQLFVEGKTFKDLGMSDQIVTALQALEATIPTQIQVGWLWSEDFLTVNLNIMSQGKVLANDSIQGSRIIADQTGN